MSKQSLYIIGLITLVSLTRFLPHPPNFTALGATGLFAGALLQSKILRYSLPLIMLFATDVVLNNFMYKSQLDGFTFFYPGAVFTYTALALIVFASAKWINKLNVFRVLSGSLGASLIFFLVSNLGVWLTSRMYDISISGFITCYVAALPFFSMTIAGDLLFSVILFGGYYFTFERNVKVAKINR